MNIKRTFKLGYRFLFNRKFRKRILKNINSGFELAAKPATESQSQIAEEVLEKFKGKKIGFIGGCELSYLKESLENTLDIETYHTFDYGGATNPLLELQSPNSEIIKLEPDFLIISHLQQTRNYFYSIQKGEPSDEQQRLQIEEVESTLSTALEILRDKGQSCPVFIATTPIIYRPAYGRFEYNNIKSASSLVEFMRELSLTFYKVAKQHENVFLLDYERIFRPFGIAPYIRRTDANGIYEHLTREGARILADQLIEDISVINGYGQQIKAVVIDLDNTLWDGIIRDDGVAGVNLYHNRIDILKMLSRRGIILTLCSKNDEGIIDEIKEVVGDFIEEITIMKINWQDKSQNIVEIANELNIGIGALAFFDDNPFERDQVKIQLPEVLVLEDTAIVDSLNMPQFDKSVITQESKKKKEMYVQQAKRQLDEENYKANKEDFLRSVNMRIWIREAEPEILDRVTELIQKTNQLNATTIRYSKSDIISFSKSAKHRIYAVNLYDQYGEYGMIGVGLIEEVDQTWNLNSFLFSCRAMGKTVEETLLTYIEREAQTQGIQRIVGKFKKTNRNGPIEDIYKNAGFELEQTDETGMQHWVYDLTKKEPSPYHDWFKFIIPEKIK